MSKFCGQCGAELRDDATFCTSCGAQLGGAQPNVQQPQNDSVAGNFAQTASNAANNAAEGVKNVYNEAVAKLEGNPNKKLIIGGGIGVIALVVLVILFAVIFGGGGYKTPLKNMKQVVEKGDGKALQSMTMSSKQVKAFKKSDYIEDEYDGDVDDYFESRAESVQDSLKDEFGDGVKFKYTIKEKTSLKKSKLEDYEESLENWADGYDIDYEPKVTKGYKVKVKIEIEGDDDSDKDTDTLYVYKVDGDWVTSFNLY